MKYALEIEVVSHWFGSNKVLNDINLQIADGQIAALSIDRYLGGPGILPPDMLVSLHRASDEELENAPPMAEEPMVALADRLSDFREVVHGFGKEGACAEANRCLRCDLEKLRS